MHAIYSQGATLEDVGRQFGLTRERVRQIFAAAALPTRDRRDMRAPRRDSHLRRSGEIVAAYERLGSMTAVKKELQIPLGVVREIVRRERPTRPRPRRGRRYRYSREELLTRLTEAAEVHGGPLTIAAYEGVVRSSAGQRRRWPVPETYSLRFGSWSEAITAAGLPATGWRWRRRRYSREDCLTAVARLTAHIGEEPTVRVYDAWAKARDGVPSFTTVIQRCGTWRAAVRDARGLRVDR